MVTMAVAAMAPGFAFRWQRRELANTPRSHQQRSIFTVRAFGERSDDSSVSTEVRNNTAAPKQSSIRMPLKFITALSSAGAVETAYLTWLKISGSSAICSAGSAADCNDVLNSKYSVIYGVPLPLVGFVAYATVAFLGFAMLQSKSLSFEEEAKWILLCCTTAMSAASGFFIYLLNTKLEGATCVYCIASALTSFLLCVCTLKGFKWKDAPQAVGLQFAVIAAVIVTLSSGNAFARSDILELPPVEPEVTTTSDATKVALAKHLKSIGAKMYGAFWCSHCHGQKQMLGQEAVKALDYVECYPEGYGPAVQMADACKAAKIEGFPTWMIKGQAYPGELTLEELAGLSGFALPK